MRSPQFYVVLVLMMAAAVKLEVRGDVDHVPPSVPLSQLASRIGAWTSIDVPIDDQTLNTLGKGEFLSRVYTIEDGNASLAGTPRMGGTSHAPVGLFVGYFPTQRTGQTMHSPQHCLPGAGWTFVTSGVTELKDRDGKAYTVGEYLISDGRSNDEVLYWYKLHGRSIASDYKAKMYTLADSIRYGRTDAALVRVITPVRNDETRLDAHNRAVGFAEQMVPLLPRYIPD